MVTQADKLAALQKIAQLKADRELKKFAAFNLHMIHARNKADAMRAALEKSYDSPAPLSVSEARVANAQAGRSARELTHAEAELRRMKPRFDAVRKDAAREFGRAQVLQTLAQQVRDAARRDDRA